MKKLILTSAFILGSIITVFAQSAKPGQPIGGIVVKGGRATDGVVQNPLFEQGGHTAQNPMAERKTSSDMNSAGAMTNPYYVNNGLQGDVPAMHVAGNPIGGIIVKGGSNKPAAMTQNPLYTNSGNQGSNPLYKGKD